MFEPAATEFPRAAAIEIIGTDLYVRNVDTLRRAIVAIDRARFRDGGEALRVARAILALVEASPNDPIGPLSDYDRAMVDTIRKYA